MKRIVVVCILLLSTASLPCFADWSLDAKTSRLHVISVKNAAIAEVHHFTKFDGKIDSKGQVALTIDLASIETQIPIRNERMAALLFDTSKFASANISGKVDVAKLNRMTPGEQISLTLPCLVQLHGKEKPLEVDVSVVSLAEGSFQVTSVQPVLISLADFELVAGVQVLQEIAKLNSIAVQVPVTFSLYFNKAK